MDDKAIFRRIVRKRTVAFRRPSPRETTSRRPHPVHPILPGGPIRASRRARNGVAPDKRRHPGGQGGRVDCEGPAVAGERFDGPRRGRPLMNDLSTMHTVPPGSVVHVPQAVAESTPVQPPCPAHRVYAPQAVAGVGAGRVAMIRGYTRSAGSPGPFGRKSRPRLIAADGAAAGGGDGFAPGAKPFQSDPVVGWATDSKTSCMDSRPTQDCFDPIPSWAIDSKMPCMGSRPAHGRPGRGSA